MRKKEKCYIIVDKHSKMLYGAFNHTEEGKKRAEKYLKKINKDKNLEIVEK